MRLVCHRVSSASCSKGTWTLEESMKALEVEALGVPVAVMIVAL